MFLRTENGVLNLEQEIELLKSQAIDKINDRCDLLYDDFYNHEGLTIKQIEEKRKNNIDSLKVETGTNDIGFYIFVYSEDMEEYGVEENYGKFVRQAETIKELVDAWVFEEIEKNNHYYSSKHIKQFSNETVLSFLKDKVFDNAYASIWVDGNLFKVAKMNDKGELEILDFETKKED